IQTTYTLVLLNKNADRKSASVQPDKILLPIAGTDEIHIWLPAMNHRIQNDGRKHPIRPQISQLLVYTTVLWSNLANPETPDPEWPAPVELPGLERNASRSP